MKAIVHIGAPKTGSSTLQEFLFLNESSLATQGFRFKRNVPGRGSQYEFPLAALALIDELLPNEYQQMRYSSTDLAQHKAIAERHLAELAQDVKVWDEPIWLFSTEHATPWLRKPNAIRSFHMIFREHFSEVSYVLYLRKQEDLIVSQYSEAIKRGDNESIQQFFDLRLRGMDHYALVDRWVRAVGRHRMDIRLMDPSFLVNGDLIDDFCHACGISPEPLVRATRINESLSAAATELLRAFNKSVPALLPDGFLNPLRSGLLGQLTDLSKEAPRLALNVAMRKTLASIAEESNERLRSEFFPGRPELFSTATPKPAGKPIEVCSDALDLAAKIIVEQRTELQRKPKTIIQILQGEPPVVRVPPSFTSRLVNLLRRIKRKVWRILFRHSG